jgi:hypothetical protein
MIALERAWSTIEVVAVTAILVILLGAGTVAFAAYQHNSVRIGTMKQLVGIVSEAKGASSSEGSILEVAPSGVGSVITIYSGWTITPTAVLEKFTTPTPVGLRVGAAGVGTSNGSFDLYVSRNGSFYASLAGVAQSCASLALGAMDAGKVGNDAYPLDCSELALDAGLIQ